ncbi:YaaL family protein [Pontibacillus litoralis]|nr:YaaL family protein [Pontibacillus litoralis]
MIKRKRIKKEYDQQLLEEIRQLKQEWMSLKKIMDCSVDASEFGQCDLAIARVKYLYLLNEARKRNIRAQ